MLNYSENKEIGVSLSFFSPWYFFCPVADKPK